MIKYHSNGPLNPNDIYFAFERGALPTEKEAIRQLLSNAKRQLGVAARYQEREWPQECWYQKQSNEEIQVMSPSSECELPHGWKQVITDSEKILDLEDDWDGDGACAYVRTTLDRATQFLETSAKGLWKSRQLWLSIPFIEPGPNGSIDIHWRTEKRELLINIPADVNQLAGYYGDEMGKNSIKGKLDTSEYQEWITIWLMK
jgi:hypothetical protein